MAKKKKKSGVGYAIFMVLWAVLLLGATGYGLYWFWGCMEGYEASRPHIAIDAYMEKVDKEYIVDNSQEFLSVVDFNIQSREECTRIMLESLEGEISYARKASACTEDKQVYVIRCGDRAVGTFTIVTDEADEYGFTPWVFLEDSFDLSAMMGTETVTVTAPEGFRVLVNNFQLDDSYIVSQERMPYELFENYYDEYDLPEYVLNTYEVGPFLNAMYEAEIYTPEGKGFVMDENFDPYSLIPAVEEETAEELEEFLSKFLDLYVIFAGCANDSRHANYQNVIQYVVRDSNLAKRMYDALDGLQFAQSRGDKIADIQFNRLAQLDDGAYLFDVTYQVDTTGHDGVVRTTTNARIVIVRSEGKLLVESMSGY